MDDDKYLIRSIMKSIIFAVLMSLSLTSYAKTGKEIISENGFKSSVEPMLTTEWSQDGGENSMLPYITESKRAKTGCGATALGQIMKFWGHPAHGTGDNYYVWDSLQLKKVVLYADFEHTYYDWDKMISLYKDNSSVSQQQIDAVSTLMRHLGIALEMKYTAKNGSATQIEYIHTILKKYFGYNSNSQLVRYINGAYSMDEWLTMIYRELSEGRPVLMGGRMGDANHIYVADGYDKDGNVHLNLGHANIDNENRYYDLSQDNETYTNDMRMIIGISPESLPAKLTTIHISTSGTLVEKLGGELESRKICRLKVTGTLDNSDLAWLRELTQITTGQLSYLDLSDCNIQGNSLPASAFAGSLALQEIILPNSLTTIGNKAFQNCYGLYKVGLPQGLSRIESYAFTGCRYLGDISLPSSVSYIGNNPFCYNKMDRLEVDANNTNYKIENHALLTIDGKKLLSMPVRCFGEYILPEGVETIGTRAFLKDCMLTSVVLPSSLSKIETKTFSECYSLKNVYCSATTPPSIVSDSFDSSISNCTLHVPQGCISIYEAADYWNNFQNIVEYTNPDVLATGSCGDNVKYTIYSDMTMVISGTGAMWDFGKDNHINNDYYQSIENVIIEDGVTTIGNYSFYRCTGLTSVKIPNSVTSIGDYAFRYCSGLSSVIIPNSVTSIGIYVFTYCTGLVSVTIPNSLTSISACAFNHCYSLTSVTIPNTVTSIGKYAFHTCTGLTSITIPNSVASIGTYAFRDCSNLSTIRVENETPPSIEYYTFDRSGCTLYVPKGSKSAYENAEYWNEFENILEIGCEPDTDISAFDNAIYVEQTEARIGGSMDIPVKMKSDFDVRGFQFTMELPEGTTINSWQVNPDRLPSGISASKVLPMERIEGNRIVATCVLNDGNKTFTGYDGEIATVNVTFGSDMAAGTYPIYLTEASISDASSTNQKVLSDIKATLVLDDYVVGDTNGDGKVLIGDVISILNYIVGERPEGFNEKAADVNSDGKILVGDVIAVLNIIVGL